jgi:hypothetical protein
MKTKKQKYVRFCDSPEAQAALDEVHAILNKEMEEAIKRDKAEGYVPPKRNFATGLIIEPPKGLM